MENTILTFSGRDLQYIKTNGCDDNWVLNKDRARSCKYLVCCHSQGAKRGHAFLVGLISQIRFTFVDKDSGKDRWAIHISEYASIDIPNMWKGWRNPVHYTSLDKLGIDLSDLKFEKLNISSGTQIDAIPPLSIEQAKEGIAKKFGISSDQIEVVIKG